MGAEPEPDVEKRVGHVVETEGDEPTVFIACPVCRSPIPIVNHTGALPERLICPTCLAVLER